VYILKLGQGFGDYIRRLHRQLSLGFQGMVTKLLRDFEKRRTGRVHIALIKIRYLVG
jgi:hypothetical protein